MYVNGNLSLSCVHVGKMAQLEDKDIFKDGEVRPDSTPNLIQNAALSLLSQLESAGFSVTPSLTLPSLFLFLFQCLNGCHAGGSGRGGLTNEH